ncbi:hypothetical protein BD779DRAFT_1534493 [Infundibulicybe gibba]|nr:hypothetical protein BD779DRAFT_1534493 [Infundibulicybe gibba]
MSRKRAGRRNVMKLPSMPMEGFLFTFSLAPGAPHLFKSSFYFSFHDKRTMFCAQFSFLFLCLLGQVLASPMGRRQADAHNCRPDSDGTPVSIANNGGEWRISSSSIIHIDDPTRKVLEKPDFLIEPTGSTVVIKNSDDNMMVVGENGQTLDVGKWIGSVVTRDMLSGGFVERVLSKSMPPAPKQQWNLVCDSCSPISHWRVHGHMASGCRISSVSTSRCIQTKSNSTEPLKLVPCDGKDDQKFELWTRISLPMR